jgi:hypothetical protein
MATIVDRLKNLASNERSAPDKWVLPDGSEPGKLIAWLEDHRKKGFKHMPDLQMKMNLAYLLGHQWIVWDRDRRQFRRPQWRPNDPNAPVRITINMIGGIVERTIARLLKEAPDPECRPVSDDETDTHAADVGSRILDHEMDRVGWDVIMVELYFWVVTLGWSFLHVYWDANAGTVVGEVASLEGGENETAAQEASEVHQGEVCVEMVPAFELSVDPNARKMEAARWAIRTVSLTKEGCFEKYGVVPPTDLPGMTLVDEVYALTDKAREDRPYVETVSVHQLWIRPGSRIAPDGAVITWAGTTVLEKKDFPYDHGELPFVQFDLLPGMGMREGRTWVTDLIQIQADYNDARSREASIRRVLTPKLVFPVGAIDQQRISSRVELIPYNQNGNPPNYLMPDSRWMAQHETVMDRAKGEMGDRAGQADVSSGNAPASMPAASVMALQEADDTKLAISRKLMGRGISKTGWQWLMLVKQFWQEPRIVRTWSQEGDMEVMDFLGADLGQTMDVHVSMESALPKSKAARMNILMQLLQIPGMFTNPRDFLKQLDMPGISPLLAAMSIDNKQAERENSKMLQGDYLGVRVNEWDNHTVHIQEHNDFRKGQEYEKLMIMSLNEEQTGTPGPATQAVAFIDAHVDMHQQAITMQQMAPPQLPGQPGGAPGTTTPPPQQPQPGEDQGQTLPEQETAINQTAGIGGPAEPGAVPGVPADTQAASMGQ